MASGGSNMDYNGLSFQSRQSFDRSQPPTDTFNANGAVCYSQPYDDQSRYQEYNRGYNRRSHRGYGQVPDVHEEGVENAMHRSSHLRGENSRRGQTRGQQGKKLTAERNSTSKELGFRSDTVCDNDSARPKFDQVPEQKTRNYISRGNSGRENNEHQENFHDSRHGDKWRRGPRSGFNDQVNQYFVGDESQSSHNYNDSAQPEKNWRKTRTNNTADSKCPDDGLKQVNYNESRTDGTENRISDENKNSVKEGPPTVSHRKDRYYGERFTDRDFHDGRDFKPRRGDQGRQNRPTRGSKYVEEVPQRDSVKYGMQAVDELDHRSRGLHPDERSEAGDSQTSRVKQSVDNRWSGARIKSGNWRDGDEGAAVENYEHMDSSLRARGRRRGKRNRRGALEGGSRMSVDSEGGHQASRGSGHGVKEGEAWGNEAVDDEGYGDDSAPQADRRDVRKVSNYRNVTKDSRRQTKGRWEDGRYSTDYNNRGRNEEWKRPQQGANRQRVNDVQHGWNDPGVAGEKSVDIGDDTGRKEPEKLNDVSVKKSGNWEASESRDVEAGSSKERERISEGRQPKRTTRNKDDDFPRTANWRDETQRGLLIDQLCSGKYECLVCFNIVRSDCAVWSCSSCYHIYHLYCIKKWAQSSAATPLPDASGTAWRCPTCQGSYLQVPNQYTCFCGKERDPEFNRYATPHSCNEVCSRERNRGCPHLCTLLCHPGPCPPCSAFVMRSCDCGRTKRSVKCVGDATSFKCTEVCGRTLNCGQHVCDQLCHAGSCIACTVELKRICYCGRETKTVRCGSGEAFVAGFTCGGTCGRRLECDRHDCVEKCHPGPCVDCPRRPDAVTRCACGKTPLVEILGSKPRKTCEDPIATCEKVCDRELECGNADSRHRCRHRCHEGACPTTCDRMTDVTCRCGTVTKEMSCVESLELSDSTPFVCDRRCKKKMSCGRHRCNQTCCTSEEHQCQVICGYKLSCGLHRCEEPCHKGNCPSCWQVSFDELRCYCGSEVIYPPIPCGTKPPECNRPCTRQHTCNHPATHHCHSDEVCPPCTVLTEKRCLGRHELRRNIPCYVAEISCGMQCGKELPCLVHKCQQSCHKGACLEGKVCTQPCPMIRSECGHPCQAPCHPDAPCPATVCKAEVTLQCDCGRRKEKGQCMRGHDASGQSDYSKMTAQLVASKLWEGQSIDISVFCKELGNKKTRKLQCNSECSIQERNQRLALALEIKNPDLSSKLGNPSYSQFLKDFARQTPTFVAGVEKALSDLVLATQQPRMSRKIHSFKVMPSNQRRVVHELAEFYGCQTESYDEEPNKNVVATAIKDKCWLPSVTLTSLVQRELFPKAPVPIPINCKEDQIRSAAQAAKQSTQVFAIPSSSSSSSSNRVTTGGQTSGGSTSTNRRNNEPKIDYFDFTD